MRIAICGGGIGGLACAIALRAQDLQVDVYETSPQFSPVGAGITLAFNAMQVMRHLGLEQAIARQGHRLTSAMICDDQNRSLSSHSLLELETEFGIPFIGITRWNLHEVLVSALPAESLHLGKKLRSYQNDPTGVTATFDDGTALQADLLICADGIHSVGRSQMYPQVQPRYAGQTSWRGLLSSQGLDFETGQALEAWGPGTRFGALEVGPGLLYWFATAKEARSGLKSEREARHKSDVLQNLALYHPKLKALPENTAEEAILRTDIFDLPALPSWHDGRVVLLGDAAHATTPNLGQGAAQALEDAYCLALCLAKFELKQALSNYWQWRHQKARWVVDTSRRFGWVGGWSHPLAVRARNWLVRKTPPEQGVKTLRQIGRLDWLD